MPFNDRACAVKEDRSWVMSWFVSISTQTLPTGVTVESFLAGMASPLFAMRMSRPSVLSATVLPPALGPVMMRQSLPRGIRMSRGTVAIVPRRSRRMGWRAPMRFISSPPMAGITAPDRAAHRALAASRSSLP